MRASPDLRRLILIISRLSARVLLVIPSRWTLTASRSIEIIPVRLSKVSNWWRFSKHGYHVVSSHSAIIRFRVSNAIHRSMQLRVRSRIMADDAIYVIGTFDLKTSGDGKVSHGIGWRHFVAQHQVRADKISCFREEKSLFLVSSFHKFPLTPANLTRSIQAVCAMNPDELFCKQRRCRY